MRESGTLLSKTLIASVLATSTTLLASAQISFGGEPASFGQSSSNASMLRSTSGAKIVQVLPNFNPDDLRSSNQWSINQTQVKPFVVGQSIDTKIDFAHDAECVTLESGLTVYRLVIETKGALSNTLYYDDFFIPRNGGELYIYTPDRKTVLGKFTHETHPSHGAFATEPLPGSVAILEYQPSLNSKEMPSILISSVGHLFIQANATEDPGEDRSSEMCSININCPEGSDWQVEKAGVAQIMMRHGDKISLCTGNLLNNTQEDFKPYIISAAHCESLTKNRTATEKDLKQWIFTFHYEKPGCSNGAFALGRGKTMIGCDIRAFLPIQGQSDGMLLELKQQIPDSYRVYYNGWDSHENKMPQRGVGIHHPSGDAKKISVYDGNVSSNTWHSWDRGQSVDGGTNAHYYFTFTQGETQGGSSGSSLWNEKKLVVGTLSGGSTLRCQSSDNYYGKLSYHWDHYKKEGDPSTQMGTFLDPKGKGTTRELRGRWKDEAGKLRPLPLVTGVKISRDGDKLRVTWDAIPSESLAEGWKVTYNISRNGVELNTNIEGTEYSEPIKDAKKGSVGSINYGVRARYDFGSAGIPSGESTPERIATTEWVVQGIYIGERTQQVEIDKKEQTSSGLYLSWRSPYNLQEVTLFGPHKADQEFGDIKLEQVGYVNGIGHPKVQTFGAKYPTGSFQTKDDKPLYVHGIRVVPTTNKKQVYHAYVHATTEMNLRNIADQVFDVPDDWQRGQWVTVMLYKPIKIDTKKVLYAGVTVPNSNSDIPSICYLKNTSDEAIRHYVDGKLILEYGKFIAPYSALGTEPAGFSAISILVSDVETPLTAKDDQRIFVTGRNVVDFPKVKNYVLKRGTEELYRGLHREFVVSDGKESDQYTIEVEYEESVYTGNETISTEVATPCVYPTEIGQEALLHLNGSEQISMLSIYTMDGHLVKRISCPSAQISVEELLPNQTYLIVLDGIHGRSTHRIKR